MSRGESSLRDGTLRDVTWRGMACDMLENKPLLCGTTSLTLCSSLASVV